MATVASAPPLTYQDIKKIQEGLGRFMDLPWHNYKRITALPGNAPEILEQAYQETKALGELDCPNLDESRRQSLDSLKTLRWTLEHVQPDPETGYPLNMAQVLLYCQAWKGLEKIRKEFAENLLEVMEPFIGVVDSSKLDPPGGNLSVDIDQGIADSLNIAAAKRRESTHAY